MKPHGIFTLMLRKRLVSKEEMAFIMAIAEEIRRMTGRDGCYDNDMGHVLDGNHDVTVTIDGKSLMPGDRQHEITRITGTIRKLMNKELPLAENERSRDVIIKEMTLHYPSEKLELVVNSAFLPTFGMDACNALPASTGHPGRTQTMA